MLFLYELNEEIYGGSDAGAQGVHGVSTPGKSANVPRDGALKRLLKHYFGFRGIPPLYNDSFFARRHEVPRAVFDKLLDLLKAWPDFARKTDAVGKKGIHI